MKASKKRFLAFGLVMCMSFGTLLGGCTPATKVVAGDDYATTVVAEYNGSKVMLDEANFMFCLTQFETERYIFLRQGYTVDWTENADNLKKTVMQNLLQTKLLCSKAEEYGISLSDRDKEKVEEKVGEFWTESGGKLQEVSGATDELLTKIYTENALANRVYEYLVSEAEVNEEDYLCKEIEYLRISLPYPLVPVPAEGKSLSKKEQEELDANWEEYLPGMRETAEEIRSMLEDPESTTNEIIDSYADSEYAISADKTDIFKGDLDAVAFGESGWELSGGDVDICEDKENSCIYVLRCTNDNDTVGQQQRIETELTTVREKLFTKKYEELTTAAGEPVVYEDILGNVSVKEALFVSSDYTDEELTRMQYLYVYGIDYDEWMAALNESQTEGSSEEETETINETEENGETE